MFCSQSSDEGAGSQAQGAQELNQLSGSGLGPLCASDPPVSAVDLRYMAWAYVPDSDTAGEGGESVAEMEPHPKH
jgi:hypothetical protein